MAEDQAPGYEKEADLVDKWDKFQNRGYWGYHEGEEGDDDGEQGHGTGIAGCGAGGG